MNSLIPETGVGESTTGLIDVDRQHLRFRVSRKAYVDEEIFKREREIIFNRCWLYVGHASEISKNGDFVARQVGGRDIIFSRDHSGDIRAFFNACAHRGAIICREAAGNTRVFTCPYHGWVFDLKGQLRDQAAKSGYQDNFNENGLYNLNAVPRLSAYRDFYFLNFNSNACDLVDYLAGAAEYIDLMADQTEDGMEILPGGVTFETAGNWKLQMENNFDAYHGAVLHATYFEFLDKRISVRNSVGTQKGFAFGLGGGHGAFEIDLKSGRPIAQWIPAFGEKTKAGIEAIKENLEKKFGAERGRRIAESQRNLIIFPNLVIADNLGISVRTVFPLSAARMRMSFWVMAPKNEEAMFRKLRFDNFLTFVGPTGFATPDDIEIFALCQRGASSNADAWTDNSKGMTTDENFLHGRADMMDETQMRAWWTQWDRVLSGSATLEKEAGGT